MNRSVTVSPFSSRTSTLSVQGSVSLNFNLSSTRELDVTLVIALTSSSAGSEALGEPAAVISIRYFPVAGAMNREGHVAFRRRFGPDEASRIVPSIRHAEE